MNNGNGSPSRLFIFGWDCADWTVIDEGWRRGMLPNLRALADRGESGILMSTVPPVTAPAWTSFLTGSDPGEHGIFGFRSIDPETYRLFTVPGGKRRRSTLMKRADDAGYSTCLVTVPWTYPAEHVVRGAVVPGWDAPDESLSSCVPAEVGADLASLVERVPRRNPPRSGAAAFLENQRINISLRETICDRLITKLGPQIFMTVFPEPDQATHLFWESPEIPDPLLAAYEAVDQSMGRIIRRHLRQTDRVLVLSDHGARPLHTYIHVGKLLMNGGFLKLAADDPWRVAMARDMKRRFWYRLPPRLRNAALKRVPRSARQSVSRAIRRSHIDWGSSQAFPRSDEAAGLGIDINVGPKYSRGPVSAGDYENVRSDVAAYLSDVTDPDSGGPVFSQVLPKEEAYQGAELAYAPDLLLVPSPGFGTRIGFDFTDWISRVAVGGHRPEGVFIGNWHLGLGSVVQIRDLLPSVLASCGYDLTDTLSRGEVEESQGYSDLEAQEMEARLRELGYIE